MLSQILSFALIPILLIWIPFYLGIKSFWNIPLAKNGMATIIANYDGPLYLVVAKTLYDPSSISQDFSFTLPPSYYAAHFPLFPLLIRSMAPIAGFPYAMLLTTLLSSILAIYFFYKLILKYTSKDNAWWLTFLFAIFPARWLISRSVGSPEPLFIASITASIFYFQSKRYWQAGLWGAIAQLTKSPAILLFVSYLVSLAILHSKDILKIRINKQKKDFKERVGQVLVSGSYPIFLIPISLLGVFLLYKRQLGDFWAYFHSGDNIHLLFPPFQVFNPNQPWVGTFWLEEIIFVYLFGILTFLLLLKQKEYIIASFVGIFFFSLLFVAHRDLLRYSLPIYPFFYVAFGNYLVKKEFKIAVFFLIIPIYLFSLTFISQNIMPIADWRPFL